MSNKSVWSKIWKVVLGVGAILGIISTALQISGTVDVYNLVLLPIYNFFVFPVPLYSIPLAFLIVIVVIIGLAYLTDKPTPTISNPFDRADILDDNEIRMLALFCQTPRTTDFLKQKYHEIREESGIYRGGYSFEDSLKQLENRGLLTYQDNKWTVTQKALEYIAKYHGE